MLKFYIFFKNETCNHSLSTLNNAVSNLQRLCSVFFFFRNTQISLKRKKKLLFKKFIDIKFNNIYKYTIKINNNSLVNLSYLNKIKKKKKNNFFLPHFKLNFITIYLLFIEHFKILANLYNNQKQQLSFLNYVNTFFFIFIGNTKIKTSVHSSSLITKKCNSFLL